MSLLIEERAGALEVPNVPEPPIKLLPELEAEPPPRNVGFAVALDFPEDPGALVAIAVGNSHEGESFPANPSLVIPVPLSIK